jgi:hypothetical protein
MNTKKVYKVGISLLIALAFILPSGSILAANSIGKSKAGETPIPLELGSDKLIFRDGLLPLVGEQVDISGAYMQLSDDCEAPFALLPDMIIPFDECYTFLVRMIESGGGGSAIPHAELYSIDNGNEVEMYCTSFEDNFDIYNNWIQIDEDCGITGGYYDSFSWSDARASDGDHSMKSTMYDIYKGNQDDYLECTMPFNVSDQWGINVSFDIWVEGQGEYDDNLAFYDYLSFEIGDGTGLWILDLEMDSGDSEFKFPDTSLPVYDYGIDLTTNVKNIGGGWWHVWYNASLADLLALGLDIHDIRFRFDWHTDPQFQYEGAYVDNFCVMSIEDVREKIFQTHAQETVEFTTETVFEFPLEWCCGVEEGCYELVLWLVPTDGDSTTTGENNKVTIPFCIGDELDCQITDLIVEDSFTEVIVPDGGQMTSGQDAHIIYEYHQGGNIPGENIVITATANKLTWDVAYEDDFEGMVWSDTGSNGDNPSGNLWHKTSVDSWSGSSCLGWFNKDTMHYENDVYVNYVLGPKVDLEDVEECYVDYYAKWIFDLPDADWGVVTVDNDGTGYILGNLQDASGPDADGDGFVDRAMGYDGIAYQPTWIGPAQPQGIYRPYNLMAAYDYWVNAGAFRDADGTQVYKVSFGFAVWETDGEKYTNDQAEANGEYWSGVFIDDVTIRKLGIGDEVWTDSMVIPGPIEPCEYYTAQFEWEDVPFSRYLITVEAECDDIDLDNNAMDQEIVVLDNLERATDKTVESEDLTDDGDHGWGICGSDIDNYLSTNPDSEEYAANMNDAVQLCPQAECLEMTCEDCLGFASIPVDHLASIELSFDAWWDIEDGWDYAYLEYVFMPDDETPLTSLDWINLETWTGMSSNPANDDWVAHAYSIPVTQDFFGLRFRMWSDAYTQTRGFLVDDLVILDLFDVTEVTDPAPVYEDFEDTMDTMDNWCMDSFHVGQFWYYTGSEWCNDIPVGEELNDALVWATEIADAYEAYLSVTHDYYFGSTTTVWTEDFEAGLGGWTIVDNGVTGNVFSAFPVGYYIWYPPVEGAAGGATYAGCESYNWPADTTMTGPSIDISAYPGEDVNFYFDFAMLTWNGGDPTFTAELYSGGAPDQVLDTWQLTTGGTWFPPSTNVYTFTPEDFADPTDVQFVFTFSDQAMAPSTDTMLVIDNLLVDIPGPTPTGYIEISADGGDNWFILDKLYNEISGGYVTDVYDISFWAGSSILIRFRIDGTDETAPIPEIFWCIDEIAISGKKDTTAPTSDITMSGTMTDAGWYSTAVQCVITAKDDVAMGEIHYILDGVEKVVAGEKATFSVTGNGAHNIEFWAVDLIGNEETPHNTVPTFRIDAGSPPSVAITAPDVGLYLFGNKLLSLSKVFIIGAFTVEATASDAESGVYRVQFFLDGDLISEDTAAPFSAYVAVKHMGAGTIKAVAEDFSGNTAEDTLDITYYKFL